MERSKNLSPIYFTEDTRTVAAKCRGYPERDPLEAFKLARWRRRGPAALVNVELRRSSPAQRPLLQYGLKTAEMSGFPMDCKSVHREWRTARWLLMRKRPNGSSQD